jgi:hypothetical protein
VPTNGRQSPRRHGAAEIDSLTVAACANITGHAHAEDAVVTVPMTWSIACSSPVDIDDH